MAARLKILTGWLCIVSLLLWSALASFAPATSAKIFLLEICTAQGLQHIAAPDIYNPASKEKPAHQQNDGHCPLCLLRLAAILPNNPAQGIILPLTGAERLVIPITLAVISHAEIRPQQPRAPPSLI
jgi:hypothetical protein